MNFLDEVLVENTRLLSVWRKSPDSVRRKLVPF